MTLQLERLFRLLPPVITTHVNILNFYLSKVPKNVRDRGGPSYLSPLPFTPTGNRPWFFDDPLSLTKLKGLLKKMCNDAHVEGNFTNQKRTGHKSLDALRTYERITPRQELEVAQILSNPTVVLSTPPQEHAN